MYTTVAHERTFASKIPFIGKGEFSSRWISEDHIVIKFDKVSIFPAAMCIMACIATSTSYVF